MTEVAMAVSVCGLQIVSCFLELTRMLSFKCHKLQVTTEMGVIIITVYITNKPSTPHPMETLIRIMLCNVAHHDDLDGDGHRQLGFESVVQLLHREHHHHDHQGDHQVTHVGGGDLIEDDLQGLKRTKKVRSNRCVTHTP